MDFPISQVFIFAAFTLSVSLSLSRKKRNITKGKCSICSVLNSLSVLRLCFLVVKQLKPRLTLNHHHHHHHHRRRRRRRRRHRHHTSLAGQLSLESAILSPMCLSLSQVESDLTKIAVCHQELGACGFFGHLYLTT